MACKEGNSRRGTAGGAKAALLPLRLAAQGASFCQDLGQKSVNGQFWGAFSPGIALQGQFELSRPGDTSLSNPTAG